MQKKLIALAVVAAFSAPAFAEVTMYGVVDATVANISQTGQKSDLLAVSGGLSSSRLGAKAVEELDNGMKAVAVLEYGLDTQQAGGLTTSTVRQQMLAVAGGFGTVATGHLQTTGYDFGVKFDPTAGSLVSPLQNVTAGFLIGSNGVAKRAPRALAYISPNMGGVTIALNRSTAFTPATGNLTVASAGANAKTSATLLSANFDQGPLSVGVVYAATSGTNATIANNLTDMAVGASYDLGVVKLLGTYQTSKSSAIAAPANNTNKAMSFSAVVPVGPGAIAASYAKATINTAAVGTNANGSGYTVAYLQGLSKTTTAYVALSKVSNGSGTNAFSVANGLVGATAANGSSSTLLALGLNKKF